jgi:hypothetical protein
MKQLFYSSAIVLLLLLSSERVAAQGCVAVKNMSGCSLNWGEDQPEGWQFSMNYRYFRSYKHFRGRDEEEERVENGTEVINNDNSINLGVNYTFNNRWSSTLIIPFVYIDRSSLYEHLGNDSGERFHTQSQGLGDIRATGYYNVLPGHKTMSLSLGLGIKLPTGNYNYKDYFHAPEGLVLKPVDQSIQPGDGGTGIITEIDFTRHIFGMVRGYAYAMYMLNPRNTNGTLRRAALQNGIPLSNEMSVADQYLLRAGGRYIAEKFQASLGARMECIPVRDLIGESDGFRRPGYIISIEPSFYYSMGAHTFGFNLPIALERNRTRSVLDRERTKVTGEYEHGDAAFADWLLSVTYAYKLSN